MTPVLHSPELALVELVSTADPAWVDVPPAELEAYRAGDVDRWRQWTPAREPIVVTVRALTAAEDDRSAIASRAYAASVRAQHEADGVQGFAGVALALRHWRSLEAFRLGACSAKRGTRVWTKAELMTWPIDVRRELGALIVELTEIADPFSEG